MLARLAEDEEAEEAERAVEFRAETLVTEAVDAAISELHTEILEKSGAGGDNQHQAESTNGRQSLCTTADPSRRHDTASYN